MSDPSVEPPTDPRLDPLKDSWLHLPQRTDKQRWLHLL
jgi:hypothetical protein